LWSVGSTSNSHFMKDFQSLNTVGGLVSQGVIIAAEA
jgi:hypothetical protein